ncbi:MAG: thiamine pyrophosphate-binding protein [Candidatus Korobacteraceae bacterium]|jgi:acetolactate synthase-1/2/3 large subunit
MTNTADVILTVLKYRGIDRIFGVPGSGPTAQLIEAAVRAGVETILVGCESSGAFIASVYGEIKRVPGVCFSVLAPGVTNMATGVAYAYLERAPLLAITERIGNAEYENTYTQRIDQLAFYAPITKAGYILNSATAYETTEKALRLAMEGRPGPVHLDFPKDEAARESKIRAMLPTRPIRISDLDISDIDALAPICERVNQSRLPVIVAGIEAKHSGAGREIESLAERLGCPMMATLKGRGAIDEGHPLYGGVFLGSWSKGTFEDQIIGRSDLLILVGVDPIELLPRKWDFAGSVVYVGSSTDKECLYSADAELVGNIRAALNGMLNGRLQPKEWSNADVEECRALIQKSLSQSQDSLPLHHIVMATREMLPSDGILCADIGAFNSMVHYLWKVRRPNTYFVTKGLSTMGFSLPAAVGAQLAMPERKVVCFIGDGSVLMCLSDLSLCSRLNLPITVVVFSDSALGLIKVKQLQKGMTPRGVDLQNPDFPKLAEAFGGTGYRVTTKAEFDKAMAASLSSDRFCLIEAVLKPEAYVDLIKRTRG